MARKLDATKSVVNDSVTEAKLASAVKNKLTDAFNQANAGYGQANTAYGQANAAYGQANTAYGQANTAYGQANDAYSQANTARGVANDAYGQANSAYGQANLAYAAANTANLTAGGLISGTLNVTNDMIVGGNIYLQGNTTFINVATYQVNDPLMYIAANNILTDSVDIGFIGAKNTSGTFSHTGFARDATDGKYKLFDGLPDNDHIGNVINFANTYLATLVANVEANTLTVVNGVAGNVNFDSGTLFVDSINDRIGIGTTSPGTKLHVSGGARIASNTWLDTENSVNLIRETRFGYGDSYRVAQIGINGSIRAISLGYDPSINPSGSFNGGEIIIPNNKAIIAPTNNNVTFVGVLRVDTANNLCIGGADYQTTGHLFINNSTGNVGIGTASPAAKLHVVGENAILDRSGGDPYLAFYTSGSTTNVNIYGGSSTGFRVFTGGSERLRVDSSGNLGLGVTPSAWSVGKALEISTAGMGVWAYSSRAALTANYKYDGGDKFAGTGYAAFLSVANDGLFRWYQSTASGTVGNTASMTQAMTLDASGNLLVGTTTNSLNARLRVVGATRTCTLLDLTAPSGENWVVDSTNTTGSTDVLGIYASGATGLYIKDTGDVGIGTTAPLARLDVKIAANKHALFASTYSGDTDVVATNDAGSEVALGLAGNTVRFYTATAERMRIDSSGNVGIANTAPTAYKLSVTGDIYASNNIIAFSDARNKTNISNIVNALTKVEAIRGVTYNKIDNPEARYTGVIAQEVLEVLPEAVMGSDETGYAVAYGNMVGLLIEAIKELKKEIDLLKK